MPAKIICGCYGKVVATNIHHVHAVLYCHREIENMLQGTRIKNRGILFLEITWNTLIHIMKMLSALIN